MKALSKGIFWVICSFDELDDDIFVVLDDFELLAFTMPCTPNGQVDSEYALISNSKKGDSYNHKLTWEHGLVDAKEYKKLSKQYPYNYYPRGRVEISNSKCKIYLNGNINTDAVIAEIKNRFGLWQNLESIKVLVDNSTHYSCYADRL